MGNYSNTLNLDQHEVNIRCYKSWVKLFDSDLNGDNGDEFWEFVEDKLDGKLKPLCQIHGYENPAEMIVGEILKDAEDLADEEIITLIMDEVDLAWGNYFRDYQYTYFLNQDNDYTIVVASID